MFCTADRSASASPTTGGSVPSAMHVDRDAAIAARRGAHAVDRLGDHLGDVDAGARAHRRARADAGELHHALDHVAEPAPFGFDQRAVALHLRAVGDDAVGEVLAGRADDRERRPQLVRHRGDELHLLPRQPPLPLRRRQREHEARRQQSEHAEADREVAPPRARDDRLERAAAVARAQLPRALLVAAGHQHALAVRARSHGARS